MTRSCTRSRRRSCTEHFIPLLPMFCLWKLFSRFSPRTMIMAVDGQGHTWQQVLTRVKRTWSEESLTVSVGVPQVDSSRTFVIETLLNVPFLQCAESCAQWQARVPVNDNEVLTLPISEPIEFTVNSWSEHGTEILSHLMIVDKS